MENILMCRICLATDVRLCSIARYLRDMYERISSLTFKREDWRPLVACYICYARLQNCYRLRISCIRSEELLTEMTSSSVVRALSCCVCPQFKPQDVLSTNTFKVVSVLHSSLGHKLQVSTECQVKEEAPVVIYDAELDQQNCEELVTEAREEQCGLIDDNNQCSRFEDPLNAISTEEDDVETVIIPIMTGQAVDEELEIEDTFLEENEQNGGDSPSQSADNICPKVVKVVLERIDEKDPRTDSEDLINLDKEDAVFDENEQNGADSPLPSADIVCPKIVKIVLERIDQKHPRTGVSVCNQLAETDPRTDAEDENVELESTVIEENELIGADSFNEENKLNGADSLNEENKLNGADSLNEENKLNGADSLNEGNELNGAESLNEENELNGADSPSPSADIVCPKIVKIVLERIDQKDPRTGVPVCDQLAETDSHLVTDPEDEGETDSQMVTDPIDNTFNKNINVFGKHKTNDKVGATLHIQRDKVMVHYEGHEQTFKSTICSINKSCFKSKIRFQSHTCTRTREKCFKNRSSFRKHMYTHTAEKRFQCDLCNKCFCNKYYLSKHMCTHTDERRFECDVCNKRFMTKQHLTQHMYTHTDEKQFQCDVCNKCFRTKHHLTRHMFPFQCHVCNKCFKTKDNLSEHKNTHAGEKRFQCDICNKYFKSKAYATRHLYTHTGEKRFQCNVCNIRLRSKLNLTRHMYTH